MFKTISKLFLCSIIFISPVAAQKITTLKLDLKNKPLPFGLKEKIPANFPKIGLALSGGGARSISQLGVLKAFEEEKIPIDIIVGTSMGSVVGGLYSAGYNLTELDSIMRTTQWDEFFSPQQSSRKELFVDQKISEDRAILSLRMDGLKPILPTSISSGQRAANFLNLVAINAPIQSYNSFDHYKYKFRAISTDLVTGKEVIIDKGQLGMAMRASSSVSFVLPPVKDDSLMLVDGGLVANIPVKETRQLGADIVIAVNCVSPLYNQNELVYPWTIADQIVSIPMNILNNQQLKNADYIITPNLDSKKNSDFSDLTKVIQSGYDAAKPIAQKIKKYLEEKIESALSGSKEYFKNLLPAAGSGIHTADFVRRFAGKDSVSSGEILYALYRIYNRGEWKNLSVTIEENGGSSFVTLNAVDNPAVNQIILEGVSAIPKSVIMEKFSGLVYKPYNPQNTFSAAMDAIQHYRELGYSLAKIDSISFDVNNRSLNIFFNEGLISKIIVDGINKTRAHIITSAFPLKAGSYFKYNLAEEGLTNLRSTNLFDQIELTAVEVGNAYDLKLEVAEKISSLIRLGLRIDNEYLTQLSIDARDENFNGSGAEIGAILSGGPRSGSLILEQRANRVFDSYLTYKIRAFGEFSDINVYKDDSVKSSNEFARSKSGEYRQTSYGGIFGIGTQVKRFGNLFVEARYQRDEIANRSNYTGPTFKKDISSLRFSLAIDSQNKYPYPTSGFLINAYYETAQTALGGDIGYTKFFIDYKNIFSFRSTSTWSFRALVGSADNTLPLSEQFSFGGQNSFFGFREYEYRGRQILTTSLEYRYKLPFQLFFDAYVKARYDLGSIWDERQQIRLKDLRHGIGATLSIDTPIGPADFSVGKSFYLKNILPENTVVWGPTFFYFTIGYYY